MPSAARQGDFTHDGLVNMGSPNTFINSRAAARLSDTSGCPHGPGNIVAASTNTFINSLGAARLGDCTLCPITLGVLISGSHNVNIGG